jgi:hypothetical protein
MRRIFKTRKRAAGLISIIAVMAIAGGAAFAYLTSSGSGTGTGNVSASAPPLAITFSQPDFTALGQTQSVAISATNSGSSAEKLNSVAVTVGPSNTSSCPAGSFVAGSPSVTAQEIPAGSTVQVGTVSVTFTDLSSAAQNGCIGTGTVSYSATSN